MPNLNKNLYEKNLIRQVKKKLTYNNATIIKADKENSIIVRYCDEQRRKLITLSLVANLKNWNLTRITISKLT
jgi:hypothetical protein